MFEFVDGARLVAVTLFVPVTIFLICGLLSTELLPRDTSAIDCLRSI